MNLPIKLYAVARQRSGASTVAVELPERATIADLRRALAEQHPALADVLAQSRFAINSDYAADGAMISPNAEIALIPPVSGG
jgi:molybdopterin synthase catalytic subunit